MKRQQASQSQPSRKKKLHKEIVAVIAAMIHKEKMSHGKGPIEKISYHSVTRWQMVGRKESLR